MTVGEFFKGSQVLAVSGNACLFRLWCEKELDLTSLVFDELTAFLFIIHKLFLQSGQCHSHITSMHTSFFSFKVLGERLKCETKHLLTVGHRYKIVCTVAISQNCQQGIQISSRCLWEKEFDTVISTTYDSKTIHVTASVYCIYTP